MSDPDSWLVAVVGQATVLANEMAQLTDCLAAQGSADSAKDIDAYADALAARLRQLESGIQQGCLDR